jgi:hypothetical protein
VRIKAIIRFTDQLAIEASLTDTGFIAGDQQNCPAPRIKGEGHAPFAIRGTETEFLHVRVTRPFERVHSGAAQLRAELLENAGQRLKARYAYY